MSAIIKVRRKTAQRLTQLLEKLTLKFGREISYDDVIAYLLELEEKNEQESQRKQKELSNAARCILEMIEHPISGAGPGDFTEYGYDDVDG
ncbi:MAG: hypothetical protein J7L47_06625 [Candidatus Odinarchaeota archaeon]|nr:hypothetical protein [Candidatus Odinarchaeota archaeon]